MSKGFFKLFGSSVKDVIGGPIKSPWQFPRVPYTILDRIF
ncbi:MAG: hypothetical protein ACJAXY_000091 [Nonlabens sp.]|jgi:hypothetical protein